MNETLIIFSSASLLLLIAAGWFLRGALFSISSLAAQHAKVYAVSYVKGGALIAIAMLASFQEAFQPLTADLAARLQWWDWAILFFKPIAAGLAVIVAFLDKSKAAADVVADKLGPPVSTLPPSPTPPASSP